MVDAGCANEMVPKKIRVNWMQYGVDKTFLESCIHEVSLHGREGASLKPKSWKRVAEKLRTDHGLIVGQKQMKNRYDYLKFKFAAWSKLKNKTGNAYDPVRNTFNLSEEEWQLEIKSNKFVKGLRRPLDHPDLCIQLFEGSTSDVFDSSGPSAIIPHPYVDVFDQSGLEDIDDTQMPLELTSSAQVVSEESSDRSKNKRTQTAQVVNDESPIRSKKTKNMESMDSKILEMGENISKDANMLHEERLSNDMEKCMEKLATLGWGETDAKYQTALLLFVESSVLRKMFLLLQPQICEIWVKNAGAKYGLF